MIVNPVIEQIITVSIKVPVIDTRPCLTGSLVFAAAAAIGALPRPDSLENIPLATPCYMASNSAPRVPPATALRPNAPSNIWTMASGILFRIINQYRNAGDHIDDRHKRHDYGAHTGYPLAVLL